jgi:hypothetical protein
MSALKIIENLSAGEYHASPGVSASVLKAYAISAQHGLAAEQRRLHVAGEDTLASGEAYHTVNLEPERFQRDYSVKPQGLSFATKEGKIWRDAQRGKIISYADAQAFNGMRDAALADPVAGPLLRAKGRTEVSLFAEWDGVPVRARFDKLTDDNLIVDLKKTVSAKPRDFIRQICYLGYAIQCAFYLRMLGDSANGFAFIAQESNPPYPVFCCQLGDASYAKGVSEVERLLELRAKCHRDKKWPGYVTSEDPYVIDLPKWYIEGAELQDQQIYTMETE